jgi:hypothetical protein
MNWRDKVSLDGYLWFGNWSGTQFGSDAVINGGTLATSAVLAVSPLVVQQDTAVVVKSGRIFALDGTGGHDNAPTGGVLVCQARLTESTRSLDIRVMQGTPNPDGFLYSLSKMFAQFQTTDGPVFFATDFNGQLTGITPAGGPVLPAPSANPSFLGKPLFLEFNRVFKNTGGVNLAVGWQVQWDIDFYRRDPKRYQGVGGESQRA